MLPGVVNTTTWPADGGKETVPTLLEGTTLEVRAGPVQHAVDERRALHRGCVISWLGEARNRWSARAGGKQHLAPFRAPVPQPLRFAASSSRVRRPLIPARLLLSPPSLPPCRLQLHKSAKVRTFGEEFNDYKIVGARSNAKVGGSHTCLVRLLCMPVLKYTAVLRLPVLDRPADGS